MEYQDMLKSMYNDILTIMGHYHVFCISEESCKLCPIEEVCEALLEAQYRLLDLIK